LALMYVLGRLSIRVEDDNVGEAICIGLWGALAPAVLEEVRKEQKILKRVE